MWVGWVGWKVVWWLGLGVVWVILLTRLIALSLFSFSFSCVFGSVLWHGVFLGVSVCGGMYHLP